MASDPLMMNSELASGHNNVLNVITYDQMPRQVSFSKHGDSHTGEIHLKDPSHYITLNSGLDQGLDLDPSMFN